jgi:hypothetical protein
MAADREARRSQRVQTSGAAGHIEDPSAAAAVKMMMMARGHVVILVPRRLARYGHSDHGAIVNEGLQGPVDGRYAEPGYIDSGRGQYLHRAERPARLLDHATDCLSLLGIPDHSRLPGHILFKPTLDIVLPPMIICYHEERRLERAERRFSGKKQLPSFNSRESFI